MAVALAALLASAVVGLAPLVPERSPWSIPYGMFSWMLAWTSAPLASDECLAVRVYRYSSRREHSLDYMPRRASDTEIGRRGVQTGTDVVRVLRSVPNLADDTQRAAAWPLVRQVDWIWLEELDQDCESTRKRGEAK